MKKPVKKASIVAFVNAYTKGPVTVIGGVVMPLAHAHEFDKK